MKLAFWKGKQTRRSPVQSASAAGDPDPGLAPEEPDGDDLRSDPMRARARRRLIGAAALLLLVVVLVPMVLDSSPRAVPDNIPIDLPSDRTEFAPKPSPANVAPAPAADAAATTPAAPGSAADAAAVADDAGAGKEANEPKPDARHAQRGHIFVQAAALAKESAAKELAGRIGKSGLAPFVERTESNGNARYRVRLGPFATRDEAERTRARLHELGVNSSIVGAS
jgi:DedD protein